MGCEKSHPIPASSAGTVSIQISVSHHAGMMSSMKKHMFDSLSVRSHTVHVAPVRVRHRRDVVRWALERRHPIGRDALATIVATRVILCDGSISTRWSVDDVDSLLTWGIANWCRARGAQVPDDLAATLDTYLKYLGANGLLDPESDQIRHLRRAVAENSALLKLTDEADHNERAVASSAHPSRKAPPRLAPVLPIG